MQTPLFIWYPVCSTCKRARQWLEGQGVPFEARDIKTQNPTAEEMAGWLAKGGLPIKRLFNTSGQLYRSMGLKDKLPGMTEEEMLSLLASDGMLVKRPILVTKNRVLTGFREAEWAKALGIG